MPAASIWSTVPPDPPADALAAADTDGAADPLGGAADPLASTLGIGVAEGAGAYVQPGFGLVHATRARTAKAARTGRRVCIGLGDLSVGADDRDRMFARNLPR